MLGTWRLLRLHSPTNLSHRQSAKAIIGRWAHRVGEWERYVPGTSPGPGSSPRQHVSTSSRLGHEG
eukprot:3133330-Heterocapsa_arctica.AAC.1